MLRLPTQEHITVTPTQPVSLVKPESLDILVELLKDALTSKKSGFGPPSLPTPPSPVHTHAKHLPPTHAFRSR